MSIEVNCIRNPALAAAAAGAALRRVSIELNCIRNPALAAAGAVLRFPAIAISRAVCPFGGGPRYYSSSVVIGFANMSNRPLGSDAVEMATRNGIIFRV